ncbi:MAG: biopolymer transporter ExbD [candidate division KSB1 bacterium]|nr:biopolymer transporter ExbD [candidate division KSB1 bacterium]MDZ7274010.1 biopolymer transporter ExbD [candidate division KSB1 bacterium]MDZ7286383.1 biopolymer transporter ExbD [candidate division KSB1 bacterium]MDZ7296611.1 biopolymer transporter ExbD [candidate division KSB1 bacterium]MDZ7306833.1 biopolymer transporter ExbD [candidate division KSB1 bacterium]
MALRFQRKNRAVGGIPTASLPDIVFLLLIFFMVSTVFKQYAGLPVTLPQARLIEKLPGKRDVAHLWIDRNGRLMLDDKIVSVADLQKIMTARRSDPLHPLKAVALHIDETVKMDQVYAVQQQLREAEALNVLYAARSFRP